MKKVGETVQLKMTKEVNIGHAHREEDGKVAVFIEGDGVDMLLLDPSRALQLAAELINVVIQYSGCPGAEAHKH